MKIATAEDAGRLKGATAGGVERRLARQWAALGKPWAAAAQGGRVVVEQGGRRKRSRGWAMLGHGRKETRDTM